MMKITYPYALSTEQHIKKHSLAEDTDYVLKCLNAEKKFFENNWEPPFQRKVVNIAKDLRQKSHSLDSRAIDYNAIKFEQYDREISKLSKQYQQDFYKISRNFESWASRRRILINKLQVHSKALERTKEWCGTGKFTFSSISVVGSAVSIILEKTRLASASTVFILSTLAGSLSLLCSLIEIYQRKQCVEDVLRLFEAEKEEFEDLERTFRRTSAANTDLSTLFPYGVDYKVLKSDLKVFKGKKDSIEDQSDIIFCAIVLSNVRKNPDLLKDEEFISKVKKFSESRVSKIWWNRLMYRNSSYHTEKSKLYKEIRSCLVLTPIVFPFLSLAALPISYSDFMPALSVFILHSIVSFDAFCDMSVKIASKETTGFKRLQRILIEEYQELKKVYNVLTPYSE